MTFKKTTTFIIFVFCLINTSFGQQGVTPDSVRKILAIYKPLLENDTIDLAQRKVFELNENLFRVVDRFTSGHVSHVRFTKTWPFSKEFPETNVSTELYENGSIKTMISVSDDNTKRNIKEYYNSGNLYREYEINYLGSKTTYSVFDPKGNQLIIEGNGEAFEVNLNRSNNFVEWGSYHGGGKIGVWKGLYDTGELYYLEVYDQDGLLSGKSYDRNKQEFFYSQEEEHPVFEGGQTTLSRFLMENIKYPGKPLRKRLEGKITVRFAVEKDGSVSEVTNLKEGYPSLIQEAKRVVSLMDCRWIPGKRKGMPDKFYFTIPIVFAM